MKRYIRSSYGDYTQYAPNAWKPEDIELHQSIDWKSRNYEEYPVDGEIIHAPCYVYGLAETTIRVPNCEFQLMIRPNPIFPPYYAPVDPEQVMREACRRVDIDYRDAQIVGPFGDGTKHGKYGVHDRFETQELYDVLSE